MTTSTYDELISAAFERHWDGTAPSFQFTREALERINIDMGLGIRNLGDVIYSFRYRRPLPTQIRDRAATGTVWIILPAGDALYEFALADNSNVDPNLHLTPIKVPDATPELVRMFNLADEQAALTRIRYNRLIDRFLSIEAHSLQNHLRTKLPLIGQIEIDEVYVGSAADGTRFIIPVQAKGGTDRVGIVQTYQDTQFCKQRFPGFEPRVLAVYSISEASLALMDLMVLGGTGEPYRIQVRDEQHYELVW